MKKLGLMFILFLSISFCAKAQMTEWNDTLYLNYYIAAGEFGGSEEGIVFYMKNNELNAISIKYNNPSISFILNALSDFHKKKNNNHTSFNSESEWDLYIRQRDSLITNALIDFYEKNKNDYTVIKAEWVLSKRQRDYISKIIDEIKIRLIEENVFSNASEHYVILTKNESCVFIDRTGKWNKYLEIKEVLDIE